MLDIIKKKILENFIDDIAKLLYCMLVGLIVLMVVYGLLLLYLLIKRWYFNAKLRRQKKDFKSMVGYFKNFRKMPAEIERKLLAITGISPDMLILICFIVPTGVIVGLIGGRIGVTFMQDFFSKHEWISIVLGLIMLIYALGFFIYAVYNLIKYGRIVWFCVLLLIVIMFLIVFYEITEDVLPEILKGAYNDISYRIGGYTHKI